MAKEKNLEWFRHDVNASTTIQMKKVLAKHGNKGYAVVFRLMEMLGNERTMPADYESLAFLAKDLSTSEDEISRETVEDVILRSGYFCVDAEADDPYFFAPEIDDSFDEMAKNSQKFQKMAEKRWQKEKGMRTHSAGNAQAMHITRHNKTRQDITSQDKTRQDITDTTKQNLHQPSQNLHMVQKVAEGLEGYNFGSNFLNDEYGSNASESTNGIYAYRPEPAIELPRNLEEFQAFIFKTLKQHNHHDDFTTDEVQQFAFDVFNSYQEIDWTDLGQKPIEDWKAFMRVKIRKGHMHKYFGKEIQSP